MDHPPEAARTDGHAWRRRAGAILTGIGTVLADDPRLDVRLVATANAALCAVVLDPQGRLLPSCGAHPSAARRHARVIGPGRADLPRATGRTSPGAQGVNELHVEAGPTLSGAFLDAGLVDELLLYQAPLLIGAKAAPWRPWRPLRALADARRWTAD